MPNFDPMTGEPIIEETNITENKKKLNPLIMGIVGIAAVLVVVLVILIANLSGKPSTKVAKAIENTFKDGGKLYEVLKNDVLKSDEVKIEADFSYLQFDYWEGDYTKLVSGDVTVTTDRKALQAYGKVDLSSVNLDFLAELNDEELKAKCETYYDDVFVYNYKDKKTGDLETFLGLKFKDIDQALQNLYDALHGVSQKTSDNEVIEKLLDIYEGLDFKRGERKEFQVDGKNHKCVCYELHLDSKDISKFCKLYLDTLMEPLSEAANVGDIDEVIREIEEEDIDVDAYFYLYGGKLAAVTVKEDNEKTTICFEGGDYRWQNMKIKTRGSTVTFRGSDDGKKETFKLSSDGSELVKVVYNYKKGTLSVNTTDYWGNENEYELTLESNNKGVYLGCENLKINGSDSISLDLSIEKGKSFKKFSGEEFDLGNATSDEIMVKLLLGGFY